MVEVLVVLGIIGLLLAILIPAVQYSREAARKTTGQDNLRRQALAVHTFESTHRVLPSRYVGTFQKLRTIRGEFDFHSWRTAILPLLELTSLYQKIDRSRSPTAAANLDCFNVRIPLFECPSASNPGEIVPDIPEYIDGEFRVVGSAARADYEAVSGFQFHPSPPGTLQSGEMAGIRYGF